MMLDGKWKVALLASFFGSFLAIGCMLIDDTEVFFNWMGIVAAVCLITTGIGTWITTR
jgi:hypothetical protein